MPKLLNIPDAEYYEAAFNVGTMVRAHNVNVTDAIVEKILRAYVKLGQNKEVADYRYNQAGADQTLSKVTAASGINAGIVEDVLDYDELLASEGYGGVSTNIAYPRYSQETYEAEQATGFQNKFDIQKGISDFFGFTRSSVESALKGLGLNISLPAIIGLVALFMLLLVLIQSGMLRKVASHV